MCTNNLEASHTFTKGLIKDRKKLNQFFLVNTMQITW